MGYGSFNSQVVIFLLLQNFRINYDKILEAAKAVHEMKEAASVINSTLSELSSLQALIKDELEATISVESTSILESLSEERNILQLLVTNQYAHAAQLIKEFSKKSSDIKNWRDLLIRLCKATLIEEGCCLNRKIDAVKALQELEETANCFAMWETNRKHLLTNKTNTSQQLAEMLIEDITLGALLNYDPAAIVEDYYKQINGDDLLQHALLLYVHRKSAIATQFFSKWLDKEVIAGPMKITRAFELSKFICNIGKGSLPEEWIEQLKSYLPTIPSNSQRLFLPLIGTISDGKIPPMAMENHSLLISNNLSTINKH